MYKKESKKNGGLAMALKKAGKAKKMYGGGAVELPQDEDLVEQAVRRKKQKQKFGIKNTVKGRVG